MAKREARLFGLSLPVEAFSFCVLWTSPIHIGDCMSLPRARNVMEILATLMPSSGLRRAQHEGHVLNYISASRHTIAMFKTFGSFQRTRPERKDCQHLRPKRIHFRGCEESLLVELVFTSIRAEDSSGLSKPFVGVYMGTRDTLKWRRENQVCRKGETCLPRHLVFRKSIMLHSIAVPIYICDRQYCFRLFCFDAFLLSKSLFSMSLSSGV
jgi:hypothetical protein